MCDMLDYVGQIVAVLGIDGAVRSDKGVQLTYR